MDKNLSQQIESYKKIIDLICYFVDELIKNNVSSAEDFEDYCLNRGNFEKMIKAVLEIHAELRNTNISIFPESSRFHPIFGDYRAPLCHAERDINFNNKFEYSKKQKKFGIDTITPSIFYNFYIQNLLSMNVLVVDSHKISVDLDFSEELNSLPENGELETIIKLVLSCLNSSQSEQIKLNLIKDFKFDVFFPKDSKEKETTVGTQHLQNFIYESSIEEGEIKTKILGIAVLSMSKDNIFSLFGKKHDTRLIDNMINNLIFRKKIREIGGILLPVDKILCQEAFNEIQDYIIELIGGDNG